MDTTKPENKTSDELLSEMTELRDEAVAHGHDLDALLAAVRDPMVVYDLQTQIVRCNPAFQAVLKTFSHDPNAATLKERASGLAMRDMYGDVLPDEESPQQRMLQGEVITEADPTQIITRGENGVEGVYSVTGGPLYHGRDLIGAVAFFRNVTEQQRLKSDLRQSRDESATIFDALTDPLFIFDAAGRLVNANPAARQLLPPQTPDYPNIPLAERVFSYHVRDERGEPLAADQWPIARLLRGETLGGEDDAPIYVDLPDGREVALNYTGGPIRDADGTITGYVALGRDITARIQMQAALRRANEELEERVAQRTCELAAASRLLQRLSQRVLEVQEAERRSVARELHDEIGQALTGVKMMLETLEAHTDDRADGALQGASESGPQFDDLRVAVTDALERVRNLSLDLRPAILDSLGLLPALHWQFERYTQQTGVQVHFQQKGLERRLPIEIETGAYRLIQEALTNVARYASVDAVTVQVRVTDDALALYIVDEGRGFDVEGALEAGLSTGLASMRERADLLGGTLSITSAPGDGTTIEATLPLLVDSNSLEESATDGSKRDTDRHMARDITRDVSRDALRDTTRDVTRDHGRDLDRDTARDIGRDILRDTVRDAAHEQHRRRRADTKEPEA